MVVIIAVLVLVGYLMRKSNAEGTGSAYGAAANDSQAAAQAINSLLDQAKGTRSAVGDAVQDAMDCGAPADDAKVFGEASSGRQALLGTLSNLHVEALSGGKEAVAALTEAWQASAQADDDYQQWAGYLAETGCSPGTTTADYQNAASEGERATAAKKAFVKDWAPIAQQYGLQSYSWDQL